MSMKMKMKMRIDDGLETCFDGKFCGTAKSHVRCTGLSSDEAESVRLNGVFRNSSSGNISVGYDYRVVVETEE